MGLASSILLEAEDSVVPEAWLAMSPFEHNTVCSPSLSR